MAASTSSRLVLVEWPLPAAFDKLSGWLHKCAIVGLDEDSDAQFWRRRSAMTMQRRLEIASGLGADDGREKWAATVVALHEVNAEDMGPELEDGSSLRAPVSMAIASERPFPVDPLDALHLEHLIAVADVKRAGAAMVWALAMVAAKADRVLTTEPQSEQLEGYFGHLGFHRSVQIDPYLWFLGAGAVAERPLELRYPLMDEQDFERLLSAFKRSPLWIASAEEVYLSCRADQAVRDVLTARVERPEAATFAKASVSRLQRKGVGAPYRAAAVREEVPVTEAMGVLRNPAMVETVDWQLAKDFYKASGGLGYVVVGRCSVLSRAFPLPGLMDPDVQLVVEALELPMLQAPIRSVLISTPLTKLPDATQAVRNFLDAFRVRASLHRGGGSWGLEMVQSDGLVAAVMEAPPLPEDDELPRNIF